MIITKKYHLHAIACKYKMTNPMFMRHGNKQYSNNTVQEVKYKYDSPLKDNAKHDILINIKKTFDKYGVPKHIVSSPFVRTRQTAKIVQQYIQDTYKQKVNISIDNKLAEYLGNIKEVDRNVIKGMINPSTLKLYSNPVKETLKEFKQRVLSFVPHVRKDTLYVTHGHNITTLNDIVSDVTGKNFLYTYPKMGHVYIFN